MNLIPIHRRRAKCVRDLREHLELHLAAGAEGGTTVEVDRLFLAQTLATLEDCTTLEDECTWQCVVAISDALEEVRVLSNSKAQLDMHCSKLHRCLLAMLTTMGG